MALFGTATGSRLRPDDTNAIGHLDKLDIDTPNQLRPYAAAVHSRANTFINGIKVS